jgi:hypothetical protein
MERCCFESIKAILEVTHKPVDLTEPLRSARGLTAAKYLEPSFEMLVVALDALLHGFSREVLDVR